MLHQDDPPAADHREVDAAEGRSETVCFEVAPRRRTRSRSRPRVETLFEREGASTSASPTVQGKVKRMGRFAGRRTDWKKAYVRLAPDQKPSSSSRACSERWQSRSSNRRPPAGASRRCSTSRSSPPSAPGEEPRRCAQAQDGRPQQPGPDHQPLHGRRPQAPLPHHRLPPRQARTSRPRWPRSSTTRTAPRASRCCTTPTARSATSWRPNGLEVGATVVAGPDGRHPSGQRAAAAGDPARHDDPQHRADARARAASSSASAGAAAQLMAKEGEYAQVRLPSGEVREVHIECYATIGQVGNLEHENVSIGKAGRNRWLGWQAAQPRRRDEPGRPPDGRRRRARPRAAATRPRRGAGRPRASRPGTTSGPTRFIVRRRKSKADDGAIDQEGPVRGRPPDEEGGGAERDAGEEGRQDLVAALDGHSRHGRPHDRRPQRQEVHPGVHRREHGRAQARRVLADAASSRATAARRPRGRRRRAAAAPVSAPGAAPGRRRPKA